MDDFFLYSCDACGAPVCERLSIVNLALDNEDTLYCLECLAKEEGVEAEQLMKTTKAYIHSRDCFCKPWVAVDASQCPLLPEQACPCQDQ